MTTLLLADGEATAHALTAALQLGGEVHILDVSAECAGRAACRRHRRARAGYDAIVAPATSTGKNVLPRVAALLDVMQVSDIIEVVAPDTFKRPIYAGNAIETVQSTDAKKVITVRASAFPPTSLDGIKVITADLPATALSRVVSEEAQKSDRPELGSAKIVVSGGRAFGSKEKFDALLMPLGAQAQRRHRRLARRGRCRLRGQRPAGRPDRQDRRARPLHRDRHFRRHPASRRMKSSKVIVAINSDPAAPIFAVADYGLVGDLNTILPELLAAL